MLRVCQILLVAEHKGLTEQVPVLNSIIIPGEVWSNTKSEWDDICYMCRKIEIRAGQLKKMVDLNAPEIIIRNEKRMLYDAIWALDDNASDPEIALRRDDGKRMMSLKDIGFSLQDGDWTPAKKAEMEKLYDAFMQEFDLDDDDDEEEWEDEED